MPPPVCPGLIAWADPPIGLTSTIRHPLIVIQTWPQGTAAVLYISHSHESYRYRHIVRIDPIAHSSAYLPPSPLSDDRGTIGVIDADGDHTVRIFTISGGNLTTARHTIQLSNRIHMDPAQFHDLLTRIRSYLH